MGKELDEETGLYYYGARYLDPKTGRWLSGDPALGDYLPSAPVDEEARKRNGNLPGQGGVFNHVNLHVYHYAGNNPVKYVDPDGETSVIPVLIIIVAALILKSSSTKASNTTPTVATPSTDVSHSAPALAEDNRGVTVHAIRGGSVMRSGWQNPDDHNAGMGWRTSIQTEDGTYDQYGHMNPNTTLDSGTVVQSGDTIGEMASPTNGHSTGPHVHVERRNAEGTPTDPGSQSPFAGRSRITSNYESQESGLRDYPHTGVDHVPE